MPNVKISYNQSINGIKNERIKGILAEVSGLIEGEMNDEKKKSVIPTLFNETKSDQHVETIAVEDGYDLMDPQYDGDKAKTDKTNVIGRKSVSHIQFSKLVTFSEEMMEDAHTGMNPTIDMKARKLPNSYWRTREAFGQGMYINGESKNWNFRGENVDLTTYDGEALFSKNHTYGGDSAHDKGTQSNLYYIDLTEKGVTAANLAEVLAAGNEIINQMLTSNGEAQCFDADTILVPRGVNNAIFVDKVRRATGSDFFPGTSADLNTQKGAWNVVPLSLWNPANNEIILMSQDAKKMMKSMFYNRVNLGINVWKDDNTGNINYRGRTRFSGVHVDYKHVVKIKVYAGNVPSGIENTAKQLVI